MNVNRNVLAKARQGVRKARLFRPGDAAGSGWHVREGGQEMKPKCAESDMNGDRGFALPAGETP
jgi:hypothetical protein